MSHAARIITVAIACAILQGEIAPTSAAPQTRLRPCSWFRGLQFADAECGAISVFENRTTRVGRMIDIHFALWRAEAASSSEAVMLLAGGPGGDGDGLTRSVGRWLQPLRSTMDIVVVDQRGTGQSNALFCPRDVASRPASSFGRIFDDESLRACRSTLERSADPGQYTTETAAADRDDVRAALGYSRVSLYGVSYGTRLAQVYMRRFPARTRSVVLDGVLPLDVQAPLTYARTAQDSLDRVIEACGATPACRNVHPALAASFSRLLDRFRTGPVSGTVRRSAWSSVPVSMTQGDYGYAVRGILYGSDAVNALPGMIERAAATGDVSEFAQRYWERSVSFTHNFSDGLHLSVLCAEDVATIRPEQIGPATTQTFLGRYVIDEYQRACSLWPRANVPSDFSQPVTASVPTLLLSGFFDPVTPPSFAERVGSTLTG